MIQATDEDGQQLGIEELRDQILTLLFAGYETLTSGLATFCLQLVLNPAVRDRLRAETNTLNDQSLTLEWLKAMTYLERVMQEVLRLTPPVGGGFRQVVQDV